MGIGIGLRIEYSAPAAIHPRQLNGWAWGVSLLFWGASLKGSDRTIFQRGIMPHSDVTLTPPRPQRDALLAKIDV